MTLYSLENRVGSEGHEYKSLENRVRSEGHEYKSLENRVGSEGREYKTRPRPREEQRMLLNGSYGIRVPKNVRVCKRYISAYSTNMMTDTNCEPFSR